MKTRMRKAMILGSLLTLLFAGGCVAGAGTDGQAQQSDKVPPEGAVQLSEHLWMAPAGKDRDGCQMWTPWSDTRAVNSAIHWRTENGYSTSRKNAICEPVR